MLAGVLWTNLERDISGFITLNNYIEVRIGKCPIGSTCSNSNPYKLHEYFSFSLMLISPAITQRVEQVVRIALLLDTYRYTTYYL